MDCPLVYLFFMNSRVSAPFFRGAILYSSFFPEFQSAEGQRAEARPCGARDGATTTRKPLFLLRLFGLFLLR